MPFHRFPIRPHCSIADVAQTDLIISETVDYDELAGKFRMSRRSLERRFKQATGLTPLGYLQQLRVESAKGMLEESALTFNEITYRVGYEDISFFRKIFVRLTGLRPKEYQQRFTGYSEIAAPP